MGDSIQAIKAGIMEIADIFVVNKADRDGADRTVSDIEAMLAINPSGQPLEIPVLKTTATSGKGVRTLVDVMLGRTSTSGSDDARRAIRIQDEILTLLEKEVSRFVRHSWAADGRLEKAVADVLAGGTDPYSLVANIMSHLTWQAPD
jgi:LAO/AO transport system kinase